MRQMLKNKLKEQKGLTLIELLAVIVILGIIAAIAVPSILGIIEHSKQDAHIANAQQIANSAKLYIADEKINVSTNSAAPTVIELSVLITKGYIEGIKDPSGNNYATDTTLVKVVKSGTPAKNSYNVVLKSIPVGTPTAAAKVYHDGSVEVSNLVRTDITLQ